MRRRGFLGRIAAAGAAALAGPSIQALGANDRIVLGVIGIHDRGMDLAREFGVRKDVELRYLADPDSRLFRPRSKAVADWNGAEPTCVQDFRRILDDPEVDAVAVATPDHWHALCTIQACRAGKDVYVEKPTAHNVWESRKMVEAARKYDRVVQVGTQNRSAEYLLEALNYARTSDFGDIHFVRVLNNKKREVMESTSDGPVPEGVDYDLWLGPAPSRPFNENHFHYKWHWFWDYSGGDLINDGIHQIDLARWICGVDSPAAVSSAGGNWVLSDGRDTPDTQTVNWEFEGLLMTFEQTLWTPYMTKTPLELRDTGVDPNWPFNGTRVEIYGSRGFLTVGRMGDGWQAHDVDGKPLSLHPGKYAETNARHAANFLDAVRSRNSPNADIEEGHRSTLLAHIGNIAYRTGRRLTWDGAIEVFPQDPEASQLLRRTYREPWIVPEKV